MTITDEMVELVKFPTESERAVREFLRDFSRDYCANIEHRRALEAALSEKDRTND